MEFPKRTSMTATHMCIGLAVLWVVFMMGYVVDNAYAVTSTADQVFPVALSIRDWLVVLGGMIVVGGLYQVDRNMAADMKEAKGDIKEIHKDTTHIRERVGVLEGIIKTMMEERIRHGAP